MNRFKSLERSCFCSTETSFIHCCPNFSFFHSEVCEGRTCDCQGTVNKYRTSQQGICLLTGLTQPVYSTTGKYYLQYCAQLWHFWLVPLKTDADWVQRLIGKTNTVYSSIPWDKVGFLGLASLDKVPSTDQYVKSSGVKQWQIFAPLSF